MPNPIDFLRQIYKDASDKEDAFSRRMHDSWGERYPLPKHMIDMGDDLPAVAAPPGRRPPTEVVGSPEFARGVESLFNQVPELRGRSPKISHGPNESAFRSLQRSGLKDYGYGSSSLGGQTTIRGKDAGDVTINPSLEPVRSGRGIFESTLGHEMGHVVGLEHGRSIDAIEQSIEGQDPRLTELPMTKVPLGYGGDYDYLPAIKDPPKKDMPKPLENEALSPNHDPRFYGLILSTMQRNMKGQ